MAKSIISSVLEAQLGKYVDGLSSDSLQVGLWSGELTLQRLALKPHALAELNLPVRVVRGAVERIRVVVPWNQLGSASVQVTVDGVTALVVPNTALPTAAERRQSKQNQVERLELVRQHNRFTARARFEGEDESTFLSRLTERIVDNLQVTLRNVHVRYEDDVSNPEHPFACGVMMESFRFHSTDAEGNDVFVDRGAGKAAFTHKAVSFTRIGAYWDRLPRDDPSALLHTREDVADAMNEMIGALQDTSGGSGDHRHGRRLWILQPLSFAVQLTKNESQDYSVVAKYAVQAKIEAIACGISREQYEDIMFLNKAFLGRRVVEAHFANARRRPFHRATERPREWWDYAVRLALTRKRSARKDGGNAASAANSDPQDLARAQSPLTRLRFRWSTISRSLVELKLYMEAFRMELRKQSPLGADSKYGQLKAEYESTYPVDVIMAARDFAEEEELRETERKKRETAKAAAISAQQGGSSWYSYFFGGSTETSAGAENEEDSLDEILTAEGRADLKQAYDQVVLKEASYAVPPGCNLLSVKLQLTRGSLDLYQAGKRRPFATATLTGSLAVNVQPFEEWDARFRLQHFEILNTNALETPFHTFCTLSPSTSEADRRLPCMSLDASMKKTATTEIKAQELEAMTLKMRLSCMPIRLMADPLFVLSLHHFFVSLLPDEQLEKVWQFATSSVSEWIFSNDEEDEDAVMRSIDTSHREIMYDVLVDVNAPVIVIPENAFEPTGAVLVVDFGKLSFANDRHSGEGVAEHSDPTTRQLSWSLDMRNIRVLLGERAHLTWTDAELQQFARLVEELSLDLSVKTLQQASRIKYPSHGRASMTSPQLEVQANVPGVFVSLSEEQLVGLGRIHSSIIAAGKQMAESSSISHSVSYGSEDDSAFVTTSDTNAATVVAARQVANKERSVVAAAEKCVVRVQISLGEIVVNVCESAAKNAFLVRLLQMSLDSSVFASHYTVEAKLKSLVMHDKLYSETSAFYELISTGSSVDQELISVSLLGFTSSSSDAIVKQLEAEASCVVINIRCHILDVQWNPSSMALLYRIGSAYVSALNFYSQFDDFEDALEETPEPASPERVPERSGCSTTSNTQQLHDQGEDLGQQTRSQEMQATDLPPVLLRASLVQFSITFNKDQTNRQLVRLAMKDSAVQISSHVKQGAQDAEEEQTTSRAVGHIGNFVVTDMSMAKHPVYSPLVGLDEREVFSGDTRSRDDATAEPTTQALVEFAFTLANSTTEKSTLQLEFRPIRVVYFHQQVLELVDYLLEGVMGAMVNQTLANATQLLLSTDESSVIFQVSIAKPSLILPLRTEDANHLKVTAETLKLEHFPSSVVHYEGSGPAEQRTKTIFMHATSLDAARVAKPESVRADYKEVTLVNARILCTCDSGAAGSRGSESDSLYSDVLEEPVDMIIRVEDLISANVRLKDDVAFLPRFTIESEIAQVKVGLSRTSYLSFIALVMENFGADEIVVDASSAKLATTNSSSRLFGGADDEDETLRPTVNYTYTDPNAEPVTICTLFSMRSVCCRLLDGDAANTTGGLPYNTSATVGGLVDQAFGAASHANGAFAVMTADQFSFASAQLRDCDPSIEIRIGALTVRDLAGEYLNCDDDAGDNDDAAPEILGQHGAVMLCEQPTAIVYSWSEAELKCQLDLKLSQVTGIVIPEALMALTDFFTLPTKPNSAPSVGGNQRLEHATTRSGQSGIDDRRGSGGLSPSATGVRRQSITEILLEAHSPELALTVNLEATRVGIAVPANCCDPMSPMISCVADFTVLYSWKPGSPSGEDDEDDQATSDFDIQSSLVLDARRVEVAVANANRQGCCVPKEPSSHSVDTDITALIQIIEPCELHVEISDLFPHARQKQQIVALRFTPIDVFVSHDDVCLALETVERLNDSVQRYTRKQNSKAKNTTTEGSATESAAQSAGGGILSPRAFQSSMGKDAAVGLEVHRYFTLEMASVCLTLINDCDGCDMGLAQFQLERCNFFLNVTYDEAQTHGKMFASPPATTISGGGSFVVLMSYYNPDTRDWHPMCTEWSMDLAIQGCVYLDMSSGSEAEGDSASTRPGENELHVILTANHPLEVTVTHGLLEVAASAGGAWKRRAAGLAVVGSPPESPTTDSGSPRASREAREKRKHAPCVVRNETGVDFEFWLTNGRVNTARQVVRSGDIADLRYTHTLGRGSGVVRKYASAEREAANMRLCVQLGNTSFQPVQGIIFEQLGSRAFPLVDVSGHLSNFSLNCYANLVDGRILLSVSSQVKVVNKLSMPIQLLVNDPTWKAPVEIGVLQPLKESAVPLLVSLGTELRVRPVTRDGESPFSWSAPIPVQQRSEVSLKVEAAATGGGYGGSDVRSAVFAASLSVEQSLRVVSLSEPIVLVNKLPVPVSFAVRMMNSAGTSGSKGETVAVGSKCGIWWTDQQQRPLFRLNIDGCLPSKWIELIHPRTKMGTVLSVMLERTDGRPFKMLMQVIEDSTTKAIHLTLYAEIWFINRTGLELIYGNESDAEAYMPPFEARALVGNAQICAYSTFGDGSNGSSPPAVRVGMSSCQWSTRFVADPRRLSWQDEVVTMRGSASGSGAGGSMLYEFGVSADYATRHFGSITTLVSFFPRYLVMNHTPHTVLLYEDDQRSHADSGGFQGSGSDGNVAHHVLAPGDTYALYWVTGTRSKIRVSVIGDLEYEWSGAFSIDHAAMSDILIPGRSTRWSGKGDYQTAGVPLQVVVKRGSISQSTMVVVINEASSDDDSSRASVSAAVATTSPAHPTWDRLSLHAQVAGIVVTIADKKESDSNLFGSTSTILASDAESEEVARLTVSRISLEASMTPEKTSAKMNLMGLKFEDLLPHSKNPIALCPVSRSGDYRGSNNKYFLEMSYLEKPHAKYKWVERFQVELQDVRVTTSMRFVDRLNRLLKETVSHFENRSYSSFSQAASSMLQDRDQDTQILQYFVPTASEDDASMTSITGRKIYVESCEIAPVRVIVSFSRGKGDVRQPDPNAGFWLTNLKFKIENACLVLDAFKLSRAMGTQQVLADSLTSFYEKSVKSQALGLIDSIQVTSLVTSVVTGGVTSLVSTILGKTDPSLAASNGFRYEQLSNDQIISKHSRALEQCQSTTQFMEQVKHLVFDWDSNHTGLGARGCVALGIMNNSRHSLVINAQLRDGAELRLLPLGRRHLTSVLDAPRSAVTGQKEWRSDRAMVLFAFGYTPTPLTSGDVYFEVRSNACNVFVTRKTARLKANLGYTATFTHQESQSWWSTNVVIVGDDLHASASSNSYAAGGTLRQTAPPVAMDSASSLFGAASGSNEPVRRSSTMGDTSMAASAEWPQESAAPAPSASDLTPSDENDEEYEVTFSGQALGIIAKQSGRAVVVRECTTLPSGAPGPALATGRISPGDLILSVNGVTVVNTTQFRELVRTGPRPLVLRLRASGARYSAVYNLFGEAPAAVAASASGSGGPERVVGGGGGSDDGFDLFGVGR